MPIFIVHMNNTRVGSHSYFFYSFFIRFHNSKPLSLPLSRFLFSTSGNRVTDFSDESNRHGSVVPGASVRLRSAGWRGLRLPCFSFCFSHFILFHRPSAVLLSPFPGSSIISSSSTGKASPGFFSSTISSAYIRLKVSFLLAFLPEKLRLDFFSSTISSAYIRLKCSIG